MIDLEQVLKDYKDRTYFRKGEEYHLIFPFFHRYSSDSVAIKFYEDNDSLYVSDSGYTYDYLLDRYIDVESKREFIKKIKDRFNLIETNKHEFIMEFPSNQIISIEMFIGYYIQALSLLANVDLL